MRYEQAFRRSLEAPESFWTEQAEALEWFKRPSVARAPDAEGVERWFVDGELNSCWLALDRHVAAGRGTDSALIYDSPATGSTQHFTFTELRDRVARFAGALTSLGVGYGDRVVLYMPMVPEVVIGMLACARLGAIHSVVFGGFAARELALRIDDARPKVLLWGSCGIEFDTVIPYQPLVEEALRLAAYPPSSAIVLQRAQAAAAPREGSRHHDWNALEASATPAECVPVRATDPLYVLYTSGTTGRPKGVVRDNGGHAVVLHYSMETIFDVGPGDVFWAASDVGWVVGHSYIVYAPLIRGCTSVLFEGKPIRTPDAGAFWRVIAEHGVQSFFVAPTAFRAIKKEDPAGEHLARYDVSRLRRLFLAGERLDPPTYEWLSSLVPDVPVLDHWWQTETGWPVCANPMGLDPKPPVAGSAGVPMPGWDLRVLGEDGAELGPDETGHLVIRQPLPPGALTTIWGDHERFKAAYTERFPGFYHTGDGGYVDEDGYFFVMGRTDDVINVAGHRLSTGELEEVVAGHPALAECAVIGLEHAEKGQVPVALAVLKDGANIDDKTLEADLVERARKEVGAFANLRRAVVVERLPKTRSGKILRQVLRRIGSGAAYETPSTIDDPDILSEIAARLRAAGLVP